MVTTVITLLTVVPYLLAIAMPSWKFLFGYLFLVVVLAGIAFGWLTYTHSPSSDGEWVLGVAAILVTAGPSLAAGILARGTSLFLKQKNFPARIVYMPLYLVPILLFVGVGIIQQVNTRL